MIEVHAAQPRPARRRSPRRSAASTTATRRSTRPPAASRVGVDAAGDGLMAALRSLDAAGVEIDDIALRQPTLDEVFLALTGRPTDDDTTDATRRCARPEPRKETLP